MSKLDEARDDKDRKSKSKQTPKEENASFPALSDALLGVAASQSRPLLKKDAIGRIQQRDQKAKEALTAISNDDSLSENDKMVAYANAVKQHSRALRRIGNLSAFPCTSKGVLAWLRKEFYKRTKILATKCQTLSSGCRRCTVRRDDVTYTAKFMNWTPNVLNNVKDTLMTINVNPKRSRNKSTSRSGVPSTQKEKAGPKVPKAKRTKERSEAPGAKKRKTNPEAPKANNVAKEDEDDDEDEGDSADEAEK